MKFTGITRIYGNRTQRLATAHVLVVGVGGVGSWTVEALARSGIGSLTLADPDDICRSNLNRQLQALHDTIGQVKIEVLAARVRAINPDCQVHLFPRYVNERTIEPLLQSDFAYVVDAIDGVMPKAGLIARCRQHNIPVVCCGGSGGKCDPGAIRVADLADTYHDRLLAFVRKKLRHVFHFPATGPFGVPCVFSPEPVRTAPTTECPQPAVHADHPLADEAGSRLNCDGRLGAVSFVTGSFGLRAAAHVVNELAGGPIFPR